MNENTLKETLHFLNDAPISVAPNGIYVYHVLN